MSEAIRIRIQRQGEGAEIRILMQHPMENGLRREDNGKTVAAHYIQTFTVKLNERVLINGQLNTAISRNPLFVFKARQVNSGDTLSVHWLDNKGGTRQDAVKVE
ncbi:thiosulfate oxidation carrier complex protein SoxZ [Azonexus sp.]|uniref:thiosulfate oxidation carrier complex protein SoxZ n=1 Tax=Azonexus sp. TaxID=1872668 RepID=UPI0039E5C7FD